MLFLFLSDLIRTQNAQNKIIEAVTSSFATNWGCTSEGFYMGYA